MTVSLNDYLTGQAGEIVARCTVCGDCFERCPIVPLTPLSASSPTEVVAGVIDLLAGRGAPEGAREDGVRWAEVCTRCGVCIDVCTEGVNPRRMLAICEGLAHAVTGTESPNQTFHRMAQNIRLLSGIQLERSQIAAVQSPPTHPVDVVFYAGCNVLSTPHIILNVIDLLDALGVEHRVAGGTGYCCGIVHFRGGELASAGSVVAGAYAKLAALRPQSVLTWCPTCEMHLGETLDGFVEPDFELLHFTDFLVARLDALRGLMTTPVSRRVALHSHAGRTHIADNVRTLLGAVPGIDLIELHDGGELGYTCNVGGLLRVPDLQEDVASRVWEEASAAGAHEVVDLNHACHRLLWPGDGGPRLRNFTDVLVEAIGLPGNEDRFLQYKGMSGADQVLEAARDLMEQNDITPEDVERAFPGLFFGRRRS